MKLFIINFLIDDIIITYHFSQVSFSIDQKELKVGRNDINLLSSQTFYLSEIYKKKYGDSELKYIQETKIDMKYYEELSYFYLFSLIAFPDTTNYIIQIIDKSNLNYNFTLPILFNDISFEINYNNFILDNSH